MMKRWLSILAACLCLVQANAGAQTYPAKTVRLVLPVPAGGLQDAFAIRRRATNQHEVVGKPTKTSQHDLFVGRQHMPRLQRRTPLEPQHGNVTAEQR